jgi:hypothetical protein
MPESWDAWELECLKSSKLFEPIASQLSGLPAF